MKRMRAAVGIAIGLLLLVAAGRLAATGWDDTTGWIFAAIMMSAASLAAPAVGRKAAGAWRGWRGRRSARRHEPFNL